jgi:hypothetical protein
LFPTGCNFVNQRSFSFPSLQRGPTFLNNLSTTRIWQAISSPDMQRDAARDPLPGERRPHRPQRRGARRGTGEEAWRAARHGAPRRSMPRCPPGERACRAPVEACATASRLRGATGQDPCGGSSMVRTCAAVVPWRRDHLARLLLLLLPPSISPLLPMRHGRIRVRLGDVRNVELWARPIMGAPLG